MKSYEFTVIVKGRCEERTEAEVILKLPGKRTAVAFRLSHNECKKIFRVVPKLKEEYRFRMEVKPTRTERTIYFNRIPVTEIIHMGDESHRAK